MYDLTVHVDKCYFANGVLVSNSDAMQQCAMGIRLDLPRRSANLPASNVKSLANKVFV